MFKKIAIIMMVLFLASGFAFAGGPNGNNGQGNDCQGNSCGDGDNGGPNGNGDGTNLDVDVFAMSKSGTWAYDDVRASECVKYGLEYDKFSYEKTFSYDDSLKLEKTVVIGGTTINGQFQLPLQVAYFDADRTVLAQGGLQLQAGYVQGGASYENEQGFENKMEFEGLTMTQIAYQSGRSEGVPTSYSFSLEKNTSIDCTTKFTKESLEIDYFKHAEYQKHSGSGSYDFSIFKGSLDYEKGGKNPR